MADFAYVPDQNQANNVLPWVLAGQNGFGGFGGGAWGSLIAGGIGGILTGALFPNLFGGNGIGGGSGTGYIANQLNNDSGRELIMQAIAGNTSALHDIASVIGQDFNLVQSGITSLSTALANVGGQVGMSALQVVSAIQAGNSDLASRFSQCCCDQKLLTVEQGYQAQLRTADQTNTLTRQADINTRAVTDAIGAQSVMISDKFCEVKEREYESRIEALKTELANAQRAADKSEILNGVNALVAPIAAQVATIKQAMPPTVAVPYPQLQAIPSFNTIELLANIGILERLVNNAGTTTTTTPATGA